MLANKKKTKQNNNQHTYTYSNIHTQHVHILLYVQGLHHIYQSMAADCYSLVEERLTKYEETHK